MLTMMTMTTSSFKNMWYSLFVSIILQGVPFGRAMPVIGILTEPIFTKENITEYMIAASYTKWLEVGGARSIPIPYDATQDQVEEIFPKINGVLFPGGGGKALSPAARHVWHLANLENAKPGGFFPIWGTCLGFEYLVMLASGQDQILEGGFDAENISLPLLLHPLSSSSSTTSSRLYRGMRQMVSTSNITLNNHQFGISPKRFAQNQNLSSLFDVTSVNLDRKGNYFVSTIEPKNPDETPYYGVQYHPEKNAFEYATYSKTNIPYEAIDHSREGLLLSTRLASFFVNLTRVNEQARDYLYDVSSTSNYYYPDVYTYPRRVGISFQEYYVIPGAYEMVMSMQ